MLVCKKIVRAAVQAHLYEWLPKYCLLSASSCLLHSKRRRHCVLSMPSLLAQSTKPPETPGDGGAQQSRGQCVDCKCVEVGRFKRGI
jgi:hypothetical protein